MNIADSGTNQPPSNQSDSVNQSIFIDLLLAILILMGVLRLIVASLDSFGVDYYQFWAISREAVSGGLEQFSDPNKDYSVEYQQYFREKYQSLSSAEQVGASELLRFAVENRKVIYTTATPFFYVTCYLLSVSDYDVSLRIFQFAGIIIFCLSCFYLAKYWGHSSRASLLFLAFVIYWFEPLSADIRVTNVNQLQFAFISVYFWLISRGDSKYHILLSSLVLTLGVFFKPNMIFVVILLLLFRLINGRTKRFKLELVGVSLGSIIGFFLPYLFVKNLPIWSVFFQVHLKLLESGGYASSLALGNYSLIKVFLLWANINAPLFYGIILAAIMLLMIWFWALTKQQQIVESSNRNITILEESSLAVGIGLALFLVITPLAWIHYYMLIIPLVLFITRPSNFQLLEKSMMGFFVIALSMCAFLVVSESPLLLLAQSMGLKDGFSLNIIIVAQSLSVVLLLVFGLLEFLAHSRLNMAKKISIFVSDQHSSKVSSNT